MRVGISIHTALQVRLKGYMPTKHSQISFAKSSIRIVGFACLPFGHAGLYWAAALLIFAEGFGIWEEIGAKY